MRSIRPHDEGLEDQLGHGFYMIIDSERSIHLVKDGRKSGERERRHRIVVSRVGHRYTRGTLGSA